MNFCTIQDLLTPIVCIHYVIEDDIKYFIAVFIVVVVVVVVLDVLYSSIVIAALTEDYIEVFILL